MCCTLDANVCKNEARYWRRLTASEGFGRKAFGLSTLVEIVPKIKALRERSKAMENGNVGPTSISLLEERIQKAAKVMATTANVVRARLCALGVVLTNSIGTPEEEAEALTLLEADTTQEGDARSVFCEIPPANTGIDTAGYSLVPVVRFKAGWAILKGKGSTKQVITEQKSELQTLVESMKRVDQLSDEDLLQKYGEEASSEVLDELRKRSKDKNFIIFKSDSNEVNVTATKRLLSIARRSQEVPDTYMVDDKICRTYKVGEFPMTFLEECPIHPEVILVEDYCEECKNTWAGISLADRVIVRVAWSINAIRTETLAEVNDLISRLKKEGAGWLLAIPQVQLEYEDLQKDSKLPVLRRRMSRGETGKKDPFFVKHKTH
jgi:hypothetical protein